MGSVVIPHLVTGWHVDQAIMSEEDRLVVIRFGRDWDPDCMRQDEVLYKIADRVKNFAVIYVCDIDQVPDFKQMYELYDTVTLMFFFRNKHMMCDFGTGNNNKLNWVLEDKQELIDIVETIYKGAKKGRGLVRVHNGRSSTLSMIKERWLRQGGYEGIQDTEGRLRLVSQFARDTPQDTMANGKASSKTPATIAGE
ncbi:Thioredoxin-like 4A [Friedmanniomyces endolithicus]|nr:Thioredoxin-like 4A [Friedmanniomyces endolithicus]KAK0799314.1 Thioredoxin-like 4A [Friedmanniomyces endolithicus]KAK0875576.1 Thioredoxin-like 4A [Friedmanniomyces endolithicus]KAK0898422.1 Thioredoxin-like 4A [Friedmanniomyces endolithicus]KAK0989903.1 Thioredoxin-like 4A [Friedmanniomyces endolithicus]